MGGGAFLGTSPGRLLPVRVEEPGALHRPWWDRRAHGALLPTMCIPNSKLEARNGANVGSRSVCVCVNLRGREVCSDVSWLGCGYLFSYSGPYFASYRARIFLQRPQSFRSSATCCRSAAFSRSRKEARTVIWFSFSRRASRERFAATLFFFLLDQYLSSWEVANEKQGEDVEEREPFPLFAEP